MGIALSMKELTQDIASSRADRGRAIGQIKTAAKRATGEARSLVRDFQTSRQEAGAELRRDLAQDRMNREAAVKKILGEAAGLVKGCQISRRKEGAQLHKALAQGTARRKSAVSAVLNEARQTVRTFQSQRKAAGNQLREGLAQGRSGRESEVGKVIQNAQDMVKGFAKSRGEAREALRRDLTSGRAARESAVKTMATGVNELRDSFRRSRAAIKADIEAAATAWQGLARGKPAGKSPARAAPETARQVAMEVTEAEIPDLEARLLAAIAGHPQGITLTEVAESLGVVPIVLGRVSRRLLDEGKIRKEDKTYFPVAGR